MNLDLKSKIWILCGGISEEREVSLRSGKNVYDACISLGYSNSRLFDWSENNSLKEIIEAKNSNSIDAVILMTHGNYGEDGCIQGFLDILQIPYSGSLRESSSICMDKTRTKEILSFYSLPVLKTYSIEEFINSKIVPKNFILKPKRGGSSVGITKFESKNLLLKFLQENQSINNNQEEYFIEEFIKGIELTASIIPTTSRVKDKSNIYVNDQLISLPLLELRPKKEFYDYEAKYTEGLTEFIIPAQVDKDLCNKIHKIAIDAYKALQCKSCARVDFIIDKDLSKPYILELNTLPGMTNTSDLPAQAQAVGISYNELVDLLIENI
jgi:D-alanine-D-alanine ligase